jgi:hypothetical protein
MGNVFRVADENRLEVFKELPAGNYVINHDQMHGFFLEKTDAFPACKKYYGDLTRNADRILSTFYSRVGTTGVLLTGEKGSGKSLLAKELAIRVAAEREIPCLIVNSPWAGEDFFKFIQDFKQPIMILFDEYEKVYQNDENGNSPQQAILTLLDGVYSSTKLVVLTCNNVWQVDENMWNRPGRIFYLIDFEGLSEDFVTEYCNDMLQNKTHIPQVISTVRMFEAFNFDMLKSLVEEMNRYDESPRDALRILNVRPQYMNQKHYDIAIYKGKKKLEEFSWWGNPTREVYRTRVDISDDESVSLAVGPGDIVSVGERGSVIEYQKDGFRVVATSDQDSGFKMKVF